MRISSLFIALFSMYTISFVHAGHFPHKQTIAILLNSESNPFVANDDSEMVQILTEASTKKTRNPEDEDRVHFLANIRGETPNSKIYQKGTLEPTPCVPKTSKHFEYVTAPSKNTDRTAQLEEITNTIWKYLFEESNTNFMLARKDIEQLQESIMQHFSQELSTHEINIVNRNVTEIAKFLYPTAQELAAKAAHILTMADEIADEGVDPLCYLQYEHKKVEQECLVAAKFAAFMNIYEEMKRIKLPEDL